MMRQVKCHAPAMEGAHPIYSPEILAQMQDLLSELADLDFVFEKDLEAVKSDLSSEPAKLAMIKELQRRHQEQCAPIAMELAVLEKRIAQDLRL